MITIDSKKQYNEYEVKMTLTLGKIYALETALKDRKEHSTLAGELHTALENAMKKLDICSISS